MGLFAELKRRNVFRVAIAYIVLGWLVLQVTDIAVPALRLPEWVPSLIVFLGLIGFPFALLFAWAYELTPEGIKREGEVDRAQSITPRTGRKLNLVIIAMLAVAVGFLLIDRYVLDDAEPGESSPGHDSIAVLAFENLSNDSDQEYFSDGLTEDLLNALSRIPELRVAARTSSFAFKGEQPDVREVGRLLGVTRVLLGTVRTAGNQMRISVQLVDTASGFQIWSEVYDRELTDVFEVQDDIANNVLAELRVRLSDESEAQVTTATNSLAYDHYLRGLAELQARTPQSIAAAKEHFENATDADPEFAEAFARHAMSVFLLSKLGFGDTGRVESAALGRRLLDRALELRPALAEAHGVLALFLEDEYRYDEALESNARAIAAQPSFAEAYLWRSRLLRSLGRIREADDALERAFELDPLHPMIQFSRNSNRCDFYRQPMTDTELAELSELDDIWSGAMRSCNAHARNYAEVLRLFDNPYSRPYAGVWPWINLKDCEPPIPSANSSVQRIIALVACRRDQQALEVFVRLTPEEQSIGVINEWIAIAQLRLGQWERALVSLERAHGGRIPVVGETGVNGISSNASLALDRVLAHKQLATFDAGSVEILDRVRAVVENFKNEEFSRGYRLLEAKLLLLEDDEAAAIPLIEVATADREFGWVDRYDPVLLNYLGEERIEKLTRAIDDHIDAERAELGWEPAER